MKKVFMSGVITDNGTAPILELVHNLRFNGEVAIVNDEGTRLLGTLHYRDGDLKHAAAGNLEGMRALGELLHVKSGNYRVTEAAEPLDQTTLRGQHQQLLLEAFVEIDEGGPDAPRGPEYSADEIVDPTTFLNEDLLGNFGLPEMPAAAIPTAPAEFWKDVQTLTTSTVGPASVILMKNAMERIGQSGTKVPVADIDKFLSEIAAQVKPERRPLLQQKFRELRSAAQWSLA